MQKGKGDISSKLMVEITVSGMSFISDYYNRYRVIRDIYNNCYGARVEMKKFMVLDNN
jgi:hypothetical protein